MRVGKGVSSLSLSMAAAALLGGTLLGAAEEKKKQKAVEPEARLAIAHDGLILIREGKPLERFASIADLVQAHPGLRGAFEVETAREDKEPGRVVVRSRESGKAERVLISEGQVPAMAFVRYLSDTSGLPVVYDSTDKSLAEKMIHVVAPIENANEALVRKLLETNRVRVTESASGPEGRVLVVESMDAQPGPIDPKPVPIVQVRSGEERSRVPAEAGAASSERRKARGPEGGPAAFAGVALENVPEVLRSQLDLAESHGVFVAEVDPARTKQSRVLSVLERFDVVTHVGDVKVGTPVKLVDALNSIPKGQGFHLRVIRKGVTTILKAER